jgi:SAM-dependent methyltransferase
VKSTPRSYFEDIYATDPDPWAFATSWYEQRKYSLTLAALPKARFTSAFEPGCSIGVLSSMLAERCDALLATEIIPSALDQALKRLGHLEHVKVSKAAIPEDWPDGSFDLVVLSELAYYFDADTLNKIVDLAVSATSKGATVVGVHWRGTTNYPLTGDEAHEVIDSNAGLTRTVHHLEPELLLDVWERT